MTRFERPFDRELAAWLVICAAVEERDVALGRLPDVVDEPVTPSPLLAACWATRDRLLDLDERGGRWQGMEVLKRRRR